MSSPFCSSRATDHFDPCSRAARVSSHLRMRLERLHPRICHAICHAMCAVFPLYALRQTSIFVELFPELAQPDDDEEEAETEAEMNANAEAVRCRLPPWAVTAAALCRRPPCRRTAAALPLTCRLPCGCIAAALPLRATVCAAVVPVDCRAGVAPSTPPSLLSSHSLSYS
eukprot:4381570-Pleurochrysis_carterae.AAC.1